MKNEVNIFMCGNAKDHKCDDEGPFVYGKDDGTITEDKNEKGIRWGSTTCSKCGSSSMQRSYWDGP